MPLSLGVSSQDVGSCLPAPEGARGRETSTAWPAVLALRWGRAPTLAPAARNSGSGRASGQGAAGGARASRAASGP